MKEIRLEELQGGDLIGLDWADAWQNRGVPVKQEDYDMPWHEVGMFLYFAGSRTKHVVLAYNKAPGNIEEWTITAIPCSLVLRILLIERGYLQQVMPGVLEKLRRKVKFTVPKKSNHNPVNVRTWDGHLASVWEIDISA